MPIYEYRCPDCGHRFEELVSVSVADDPRTCPLCAAPADRLFSAFAVRAGGRAPAGGSGGGTCAGCRKSSCATCR